MFKGGEPLDSIFHLGTLTNILSSSLSSLGTDLDQVDSMFAINNPSLRLSLQHSIRLLEGKLADTRSLFQREDWRGGADAAEKKDTLAFLGDYAASFSAQGWNDGSRPSVVLMLQKMSKSLALLVAQHGFGILPKAQGGPFGNGLYFASSFEHLSSLPLEGDPHDQVYLMSLVLPGNPYPLLEAHDPGIIGSGCRPGYQSHFVTLQGDPGKAKSGILVVFDPTQALPLFLWTTPATQPAAPLGRSLFLQKELVFSVDETWQSKQRFDFSRLVFDFHFSPLF